MLARNNKKITFILCISFIMLVMSFRPIFESNLLDNEILKETFDENDDTYEIYTFKNKIIVFENIFFNDLTDGHNKKSVDKGKIKRNISSDSQFIVPDNAIEFKMTEEVPLGSNNMGLTDLCDIDENNRIFAAGSISNGDAYEAYYCLMSNSGAIIW